MAMQQGIGGGDEDRETTLDLAQKVLNTLEARRLERRSRELRLTIGEATRHGDDAMLLQMAREKQAIDRKLMEMERELKRAGE